MVSEITAISALVVSLIALWHANQLHRRSESSDTLLAHLSDIVQVESRLANLPDALRFHGLSINELEEIDVTAEEFAYLLNSFTIGGVWHRILDKGVTSPFAPGSYRHTMCLSPHTRKAWPLIRKMMNPSEFVNRVDRTITLIEEKKV